MRLLTPLLLCVVLAGTAVPASAVPSAVGNAPPAQPVLELGTALAPGNSGFVSVPGQARGTVTGDPGYTASTSTTSGCRRSHKT